MSGADDDFDGTVTEMAAVDTSSGHNGVTAHGSAVGTASAAVDFVNSPFYVYDAMGEAMASGVVLNA